MKAIFVPHNLYMEFHARKESLLKFLSLSSLSSTLSPPDVAFYIRCNQLPLDCLPDPIAKTFEFQDFSHHIAHLNDVSLENSIHSRLEKYKVTNLSKELADEKNKMLTCDILDGDYILFTYIDQPDNSSQALGDVELYDRLLTQLCAILPFHQVATLPVFRAYVQAKQDELFSN